MSTLSQAPDVVMVERTLTGTFDWLRAHGHTKAARPGLAKDEIVAALPALKGAARVVAGAFLIAHDTFLWLATPALKKIYAGKKAVLVELDEFASTQELRMSAVGLLARFPIEDFVSIVRDLSNISAKKAAKRGASLAVQDEVRNDLLEQAELLGWLMEELERRLRSPLRVELPRNKEEWWQFEQTVAAQLRKCKWTHRAIGELLGAVDEGVRSKMRRRKRRKSQAKAAYPPRGSGR